MVSVWKGKEHISAEGIIPETTDSTRDTGDDAARDWRYWR